MPTGLEAILAAEAQLSPPERLRLIERSLARLAADCATMPNPIAGRQAVQVVEEARESLQQLANFDGLATGPRRPWRSFFGALAHLGPAPSAEEIDEMRREAWANFPREGV